MRGESNEQTTEFSLEVKQRAVRMVLESQGEHDSQWAAIRSVAGKIQAACRADPERMPERAKQDAVRIPEVQRVYHENFARWTTSTGNPPLSGGMPRAAAPA